VDPSARKWSGGIYDEEGGNGYIGFTESARTKCFKLGDFNHYKIICSGNQIMTCKQCFIAFLVDTVDKRFIGLQVHSVSKLN
jgi:hypothetical protein